MNKIADTYVADPVTPAVDVDGLFTSPDPVLHRNKQVVYRLDRNAEDKPWTMANISQRPSAYLRRFYYDSRVYDPATLSALIARVGIDRIVLGGDYPVAGIDPIAFIEGIPGFSAAGIAAIAGNNAARLLLA